MTAGAGSRAGKAASSSGEVRRQPEACPGCVAFAAPVVVEHLGLVALADGCSEADSGEPSAAEPWRRRKAEVVDVVGEVEAVGTGLGALRRHLRQWPGDREPHRLEHDRAEVAARADRTLGRLVDEAEVEP